MSVRCAGTFGLLLLACGSFLLQPQAVTAAQDPLALRHDGIGPLTLGLRFERAERLAMEAAAESVFSGLGCGGLNEIRYHGRLAGQDVDVMAMAAQAHIDSVEVLLHHPHPVESRQACLALRDRFAEAFTERFGPLQSGRQVTRPVSQEIYAATGPVVIVARWFETGGSCYVSARYGDASLPFTRR